MSESRFKQFCNYFDRREVPLWATLALAVSGAIVTYFAVPEINKKNEYAQLKSAIILKSLDQLNSETSELVAIITEMNATHAQGENISPALKAEAARTMSSLQWQAVEISMFDSSEQTEELIVSYQNSLLELGGCIGNDQTQYDKECADGYVLEFISKAELLGRSLAQFG